MKSFPKKLNIKRFIEKRQALDGAVVLSDMPRLLSLMATTDQLDRLIEVSLSADRDLAGYPFLDLQLSTQLPLICQRCLKPMNQLVKRQILLSPVENEQDADILPSQYEPLFLNGETVNLLHLIEDELILALPIVPKHDEAACEATESPLLQQHEDSVSDTHKPFEGLAEQLNLQRK